MSRILSAGIAIVAMLKANEQLIEKVNKLYPIVVDESANPKIVFRRNNLSDTPTKFSNGNYSMTASYEVMIVADTYEESVDIAEMVVDTLNGKTYSDDTMTMRSCYLTNARKTWQADAFIQSLTFSIKI